MTKTAVKLRPVGERVLVEKLEEEAVKGGIILPDSAKKDQKKAKVIAVGQGKEQPIPVKEGDIVILDKYSGQEITVEDQEFLVVNADDIVAIIEE